MDRWSDVIASYNSPIIMHWGYPWGLLTETQMNVDRHRESRSQLPYLINRVPLYDALSDACDPFTSIAGIAYDLVNLSV